MFLNYLFGCFINKNNQNLDLSNKSVINIRNNSFASSSRSNSLANNLDYNNSNHSTKSPRTSKTNSNNSTKSPRTSKTNKNELQEIILEIKKINKIDKSIRLIDFYNKCKFIIKNNIKYYIIEEYYNINFKITLINNFSHTIIEIKPTQLNNGLLYLRFHGEFITISINGNLESFYVSTCTETANIVYVNTKN